MAIVLNHTLARMDNLWRSPFPYVLVLHQAPTDGRDYSAFHFHIEIYPALRAPSLLKYLAGPEIGGGNFLNDVAPETAAEQLRNQPTTHYQFGSV
jgi:UDPglucose--hexose-1-phosphate uridylyltransferase